MLLRMTSSYLLSVDPNLATRRQGHRPHHLINHLVAHTCYASLPMPIESQLSTKVELQNLAGATGSRVVYGYLTAPLAADSPTTAFDWGGLCVLLLKIMQCCVCGWVDA